MRSLVRYEQSTEKEIKNKVSLLVNMQFYNKTRDAVIIQSIRMHKIHWRENIIQGFICYCR